MGKMGKSGFQYGMLIGLMLLVAVTVAFGFTMPGFGKYQKVTPVNGLVTVPTAKVSDGTAHFFRFEEGGKGFNFFIVKGSDGVLHTAFDACDVCFREKKGYLQQGGQMICKNCNSKFAIVRIGAESDGGCNPAHLQAKVDAQTVRIRVADLKAGARFF